MRILNLVVIILVIITTSCKKQVNYAPPVKQVNNISPLSSSLALINVLRKQYDSLSAGLTQSNITTLTINGTILSLNTNQPNLKGSIDSIKTQIGNTLSDITTLNNQITGVYNQVTALSARLTAQSNVEALTEEINQQDNQMLPLLRRYATLMTAVQLIENQAEKIIRSNIGSKPYIVWATAQNIADYAGDVIACPGYYLSVYTHFYSSSTDIAPTTIAARKSTDTTGIIWGNEFTVSPNIATLNVLSVSLFRVNPNTINCYFLVKNSTADTRVYMCVSPDNGATWGMPRQIIYDHAYDIMVNSAVHTVNNDRIVIPIASTPKASIGYIFSDYCYYSDDGGVTWTKSTAITPLVPAGGLEPKIVQLSGDTCLMNMRTATGFQYFSLSTDNCKTWGLPYQSSLESPSSPAEIVNISGKLIAIHNYSNSARNPLSISISSDKGLTWKHIKDIETGNVNIYGWSYPSVAISNGYLLLSYYETVNEPAPILLQYYNLKFNKIPISTLLL
jgi:hypothetical protein